MTNPTILSALREELERQAKDGNFDAKFLWDPDFGEQPHAADLQSELVGCDAPVSLDLHALAEAVERAMERPVPVDEFNERIAAADLWITENDQIPAVMREIFSALKSGRVELKRVPFSADERLFETRRLLEGAERESRERMARFHAVFETCVEERDGKIFVRDLDALASLRHGGDGKPNWEVIDRLYAERCDT